MADRMDVIIFGATGFTGKYVVYESVKLLSKLNWGIAGRSESKLKEVLKEMGDKSKTDLSKTPIILADVNNDESLKAMAEKARVIINCCGPYRLWGEPVIKACINAGTHHVDVSGEPHFMERMALEYDDLAKEKGVYIISACGFDSIPADMGTIFHERNFDGEVNTIESYLETLGSTKKLGGCGIHYGTWASAVHGIGQMKELRPLRLKLYKTQIPRFEPRLKERQLLHRNPEISDGYCLPFLGSDRAVVYRSQRFLYETEKKRPVQYMPYVVFKSLISLGMLAIFGAIFVVLTRFELGRKLLLDYPRLFSGGFVSHDGPSEEDMQNTKFRMTFIGEGWPASEKLAEVTDKHPTPPSKKLITRVEATNPGYGATCVALILSARTILTESDKMPFNGGVLPPAAAFAKTSMIEELSKNGWTFETISDKEDAKEEK